MKVVAKEFEHQGYQMKGPCAALASGKHKGNVARDVQRDFARRHLDPVALQLKRLLCVCSWAPNHDEKCVLQYKEFVWLKCPPLN